MTRGDGINLPAALALSALGVMTGVTIGITIGQVNTTPTTAPNWGSTSTNELPHTLQATPHCDHGTLPDETGQCSPSDRPAVTEYDTTQLRCGHYTEPRIEYQADRGWTANCAPITTAPTN